MGKIQFGSEVYTWFMQGTGKGYDNKLDHMIKVASEAGFTGIEPMVLEISQSALGCSKYWLGDFADPKRMKDALDAQYGSVWHVVCGKHFGSKVTHDAKFFTFFYVGDKGVLLFKLG